jgi:Ala-tRNA(Pro) deacylase
MPATKFKEFLNRNKVKYLTITHSPAYTAQEIAAMAHIKGQELAKTVIVKINGQLAMAVVPASYQVDLSGLKAATGANSIALANEAEFRGRFPECETGAMPPFGALYGMPVLVDGSLTNDKEIAFNAGTHRELIRLSYADFERLIEPIVMRFASARAA